MATISSRLPLSGEPLLPLLLRSFTVDTVRRDSFMVDLRGGIAEEDSSDTAGGHSDRISAKPLVGSCLRMEVLASPYARLLSSATLDRLTAIDLRGGRS